MKFRKFGKILLIGALSVGAIFGVASCVVSYTVGYLYVTGTVTVQPAGNGLITGYKIDHDTGMLTPINGLPISSGGANPVRAVLTSGSRFLYVLNRGVTAAGSANCTSADPCENSNITEFSVGGNGILAPQKTYTNIQGVNPFRIILDSSGSYLLVLSHDAADNYDTTYNAGTNGCTLALGTGVKTCGDITVFKIDPTTGYLSVVINSQVTAVNGVQLTYFPVPANPVDIVMNGNFALTLTEGTAGGSFPYAGATAVWPYAYASNTGQLTLTQNSAQPLGITGGTAILNANSVIYVLDNQPISTTFNNAGEVEPVQSASQLEPYTMGADGALNAEPGGTVPDDPTLANPIQLLLEHTGKWLYVANQGNNALGQNAQSGLAGYDLYANPYQLAFLLGEPFGSGAGPQCIVEDPSNQFIYTANYNSSNVNGYFVDQNSGALKPLQGVAAQYPLQGPATWCLTDGRTG
jgi:hypothetical protein